MMVKCLYSVPNGTAGCGVNFFTHILSLTGQDMKQKQVLLDIFKKFQQDYSMVLSRQGLPIGKKMFFRRIPALDTAYYW